MTNAAIPDTYLALFAELTAARLDELDALCAPDIRFVDPFNDVEGVEAFKRVLRDMFERLDDPRFRILDRAVGTHGVYVRWHFTATLARGRRLAIDGMSEVKVDTAGRVTAHVDHWDAAGQLYEKLPVVGRLMRWLRRRLAA